MVALAGFVILIGVWFLVSALANWQWFTTDWDFALIERVFGENAARIVFGLLGIVLIVFGIVWLANRS